MVPYLNTLLLLRWLKDSRKKSKTRILHDWFLFLVDFLQSYSHCHFHLPARSCVISKEIIFTKMTLLATFAHTQKKTYLIFRYAPIDWIRVTEVVKVSHFVGFSSWIRELHAFCLWVFYQFVKSFHQLSTCFCRHLLIIIPTERLQLLRINKRTTWVWFKKKQNKKTSLLVNNHEKSVAWRNNGYRIFLYALFFFDIGMFSFNLFTTMGFRNSRGHNPFVFSQWYP